MSSAIGSGLSGTNIEAIGPSSELDNLSTPPVAQEQPLSNNTISDSVDSHQSKETNLLGMFSASHPIVENSLDTGSSTSSTGPSNVTADLTAISSTHALETVQAEMADLINDPQLFLNTLDSALSDLGSRFV